jgi:hypothetical protein
MRRAAVEIAECRTCEDAVLHQQLACYPDVAYVLAASDVDEMRDRVVTRCKFGSAEVHRNDIRGFAWEQRTHLPIQA